MRRPASSLSLIAACAAATLLSGCGGSGGATATTAALKGDAAAEAVGVASAKAVMAGGAVPFAVLQQVDPASMAVLRGRSRGNPVLIPALNLYAVSTTTGSTLNIALSTDAAGAQSAGSVSVVATEPFGTTYTYPVSFTATANIKSGNLPMTGKFTITVDDAAGKNEMKGDLNLTTDAIAMTFDVAADDSKNLSSSGTIGVTYANTTVNMASLSGTALTTINGSADVTYSGVEGTGTAAITLPTGSFSLNITGGTLGTMIALMNGGSNTLTLTLPSGLSQVINNPSTFDMGSITNSSGSGTTSGPSIAVMNALTDSSDASVNLMSGSTNLFALGDGAISYEYVVAPGSQQFKVTDRSGGAVRINKTISVDASSRYVDAAVGDPQDGYYLIEQAYPGISSMPDSGHSWFTVFQGVAGLTETVDIYLVPKGSSITGSTPLWSGAAPLSSNTFNLINTSAGKWTIIATEPGQQTSVIASTDVTLTPGVSTIATLVSPNNASATFWTGTDPGPRK